MTSKQRSTLKSLASHMDAIVQVGKGGVTEAVVKQASEALDARELIKITLLKNSEISAREIIDDLARQLRAEPVQAVGSKVILYRKSYRKDIKHIEFE